MHLTRLARRILKDRRPIITTTGLGMIGMEASPSLIIPMVERPCSKWVP